MKVQTQVGNLEIHCGDIILIQGKAQKVHKDKPYGLKKETCFSATFWVYDDKQNSAIVIMNDGYLAIVKSECIIGVKT